MTRAFKIGRMNSGVAAKVFMAIFVVVLFATIASSAEIIDYDHDNLQRLTDVTYEDSTVIEYVYDDADNRRQESVARATLTYIVSGQILYEAVGLEGAVVTLKGAYTAKRFTDANGNYIFTLVPPGDYTITASKIYYRFSPSQIPASVENSDLGEEWGSGLHIDRSIPFMIENVSADRP